MAEEKPNESTDRTIGGGRAEHDEGGGHPEVGRQVIRKMDVARRQVTEAIWLFFRERDPAAIHTLAAAAHQVLVDIVHTRGTLASVLKGAGGSDLAQDAEYLRSINFPFNYFKHADRDSEAAIDITPLARFSQDFLIDCVLMLQQLEGTIPFPAKVYWSWYVGTHRDDFADLPADGAVAGLQALNLDRLTFPEIYRYLVYAEVVGVETTATDTDEE